VELGEPGEKITLMKIQCFGSSDVGRVRSENEDSFLMDEALGLFVVADGMGGHLGGKTASSMAIEVMCEYLNSVETIPSEVRALPLTSSKIPLMLTEAIREACRRIYDRAMVDLELQGMGTTLTGCLVQEDRVFIGHVGDSRCYLVRDGTLRQVTEDHSLVNEQMKAGILTPEEAATSHLRNIITRSVGFKREVVVDCHSLEAEPGDILFLCSDGLSNLVSDGEILAALTTKPLESVPPFMVQLANDGGGDDNITVVTIAVN
jgi:protein phosphatase